MDQQIQGVLRAVLAAGGGWLVGHGYIDNEMAANLAGAALTLFAAGWSVYSKRQATPAA